MSLVFLYKKKCTLLYTVQTAFDDERGWLKSNSLNDMQLIAFVKSSLQKSLMKV